MRDNQESEENGERTGSSHSDSAEVRILRDDLSRIQRQLKESADVAEKVNARLAALEQCLALAPPTGSQREQSQIQVLLSDVQSLSTRAQESEVKLAKIEGSILEQKKGLISRIERSGIVVGVLGAVLAIGIGLLALPKAFKEFRRKPDTKMVSGWPLKMSYDPTAKKVGFTFAVEVGNDGGRSDTVKEVRASFKSDALPADHAEFLTTGISFTEKNLELAPFEVSTSTAREPICTMNTELGNTDLRSVIMPGLNRLHVDLVGDDEKTRASADYCFWVMESDLNNLLAASSTKTITYVNSYQACERGK